ncbi:putative DNA methylase [Sinorhizobium kostiense]|uniref:DNA methylase n=1 Tax=Sinorhizobium kostiense TaxID=76747 RepID=A0ABS4R710_9HYPH|nr:DUF1156 domain-containing protein [Sinorhizobium kostiense]MBP2238678.1 putative DNA methylase [Sinorhizobium kostiense]
MTAPIPRKKLIEVSIPLEAINAESSRRKQKAPKGYPTAIHKYWAQRPVAACRAILFAQLVDDPSAWPDRFPTVAEQEAERQRLHRIMERMCLWDSSNVDSIMNLARWEIARSVAWALGEEPPSKDDRRATLKYLEAKAPPVYDPFSGGASIPLEAQRLGLRAFGSDLNPVAVVIGKSLIEIPPKFSGFAPVNPKARAELGRGASWNSRGAQGLADDVRFYANWMREEAIKRIGHLYPTAPMPDGAQGTVVAWLWARTIKSPDPAARGAMVPLVSTFLLSSKEGRKVWVVPETDEAAPDGYKFVVKSGIPNKTDESRIRNGTKSGRGSNFTCLLTGSPISDEYVKSEGMAGRIGVRLLAIVAEVNRVRSYVSPTESHEVVAAEATPDWEPDGTLPNDPRSFWTVQYGLNTYASIFTKRQLTALTTLADLVREACQKITSDAKTAGMPDDDAPLNSGGSGATAYAQAVATYLALVVDRMVFYGSSLCGWLTKDNAMGKSMPQQGLAMSWDFAEGNPFGKSSSDITTCAKAVADCLDEINCPSPGVVTQTDASRIEYGSQYVVSTDPPYYDNIGYADLSDFFYVWLRPMLGDIYPDIFRTLATPKESELVASPYRQGGSDAAEEFFMLGMRNAISRLAKGNSAYPITIYYAFKQQEQSQIGITSAGWASFLQAIIDAGLGVDGTWPIRTENPSRSIAQGTNALASSIVLVCRKRAADALTITRAEFIRLLRRELPEAIDDIRKAGVGPVDMQQSVIGPGMGIFSRHAKVLEDDDSAMTVKTALAIINRVWEEIDQELDAVFDPETQVALAWFATFGFDARSSGELITLANAKNISTNALFDSEVFEDLRGKAALTPREKLPDDWLPSKDRTLTIWECVQHTARVLNAKDGGAEAAGRLVAQMGPAGDQARKLAYRLFEIATQKGWSQEALIYNELAQEWSHLEETGTHVSQPTIRPAQAVFDL